MRILSFIPLLTAFVTTVAGAAFPADSSCGSEIGCPEPAQLATDDHFSPRTVRDLTNAERLRRGLPLKSPFLRRGAFVLDELYYVATFPLRDFRLL
jgi:hypothetical protein